MLSYNFYFHNVYVYDNHNIIYIIIIIYYKIIK